MIVGLARVFLNVIQKKVDIYQFKIPLPGNRSVEE